MPAEQRPHHGAAADEPDSLRRAAAHIEAHAHEAVTLADIAAAAGTEVRALQYAFRRHRDTTPLAYLRQVRLARAHQDLLAGTPAHGDTVTAIASRWGFTHLGRFAAAHEASYGELPSDTLRT